MWPASRIVPGYVLYIGLMAYNGVCDSFQASLVPFLAVLVGFALAQDYLPPSAGGAGGGSRGSRYGPPSNDGPSVSFLPIKLLSPNTAASTKVTLLIEIVHFKAGGLKGTSLFVVRTVLSLCYRYFLRWRLVRIYPPQPSETQGGGKNRYLALNWAILLLEGIDIGT
jgi:hypothetical protein